MTTFKTDDRVRLRYLLAPEWCGTVLRVCDRSERVLVQWDVDHNVTATLAYRLELI